MKKFIITMAIIFIVATIAKDHMVISPDGIQLYWSGGGYWFEF